MVAAQVDAGDEPLLGVGRREAGVEAACPVRVVAGLDARERAPVALDPLLGELKPHLVHLHNLTNPEALQWGARRGALLTLQDHRAFCPAQGKWTAQGRVCRDPMERETCSACFEDAEYFRAVLALTEARLAALRRLRVVVLSEYMRDELLAVGAMRQRVHVVPPFVHGLDPAGGPRGPRGILFAGRLVEAKGVRDAIEVWRRSGVELPLVVAGAGPLRPELEQCGALCLGWLPRPRLAEVYRSAAALLMPSRWQEPFGLAGLEALSLGTPVVAWESGGVREWHPAGERLVAWGDVDGLAAELKRALASPRATAPPGFGRASSMRLLDAVYDELQPAG